MMGCSFVGIGVELYVFFIWEELHTACPSFENPLSQSGSTGETNPF